jgi:hypothetical protein
MLTEKPRISSELILLLPRKPRISSELIPAADTSG